MRALEFLFEYDLNKINNLAKLIDQKKSNDSSLPKFNEIKELADSLQTKYHLSGEYIFWILHRYANDGIRRWEDIGSRVIPALQKYQKLKNKKKITGPNRDINQIRSIKWLDHLIDQFPDEELVSNKEQDKDIENEFYKSKQATLIYNDADIKVVVPHTKAASCYFGKNTKWCTAAKEDNMFDFYNKNGMLYIVLIKKENKRYQFYFTDEQFMDEQDEEINPNDLADQYPKLWDIFTPIAEKENSVILNKNPSEILQMNTVIERGKRIKFIKNPSEEVQLAAVKQNGMAIGYIKNPSDEVKMAALMSYGNALQFIKNPTEEMKMMAVKRNGEAIAFIDQPSDEIKLAAVKQNGGAIALIAYPTEEMELAAVKQNGNAINYIENPSEEIQLAAVKENIRSLRFIKNPTKKVREFVEKMKDLRGLQHIGRR